jgi:O-antigen/teichoic acid export membrane protein
VIALVFFYSGFTIHGLSLAHFASNTLGAIASGVVFVNLYGRAGLLGRPERPPAEVLKYSLPAWGTELISSLSQRLDVFAVSYWCTPEATGIYGVVVRVGNAVRSVRRSYDPIVITIMSDIAASGDRVRLRAAFSRATALVMLTQTPIFAGLALFADELAPLFGQGFEQAVLPILVICGFWLLNGAFGLSGLVVSGFGRSDLVLIDLGISTFMLSVLLVALVPSYGPLGASIALGLTYLITNLIQVAQAHSLSGINPYDKSVARAAVASTSALAAGGLALYLTLGLPRIASQLISAACFALVLLAFKPHRLLFKPSAG